MAVGWRFMMSTPNFYRLEIAYYNTALTPQPDVHDGFYHVSDAPGMGHELNPDYLTAGPNTSLIDCRQSGGGSNPWGEGWTVGILFRVAQRHTYLAMSGIQGSANETKCAGIPASAGIPNAPPTQIADHHVAIANALRAEYTIRIGFIFHRGRV